jgi:hypothetical protein
MCSTMRLSRSVALGRECRVRPASSALRPRARQNHAGVGLDLPQARATSMASGDPLPSRARCRARNVGVTDHASLTHIADAASGRCGTATVVAIATVSTAGSSSRRVLAVDGNGALVVSRAVRGAGGCALTGCPRCSCVAVPAASASSARHRTRRCDPHQQPALMSPASRMGPLGCVERQLYGTVPAPVMGPPCRQ